MKKTILFEFLYLLLSAIIGLLLMALLCQTTDSKNIFTLPVFGNSIQMPVGLMLTFHWLVSLFTLTLIRQIKQKFHNHFHNLILVIAGLSLTYFLLVFIDTTQNMKNVFGKELLAEKITDLNYEIALFSCFQILVGITIAKSIINSVRKIKSTVHKSLLQP
ncbi:MAG: hypothetical protein ABWZ56_03260 [Flavobacterium sp.]